MTYLLAYAKACNVELASLMKHLQSDPEARAQFEEWKRNQYFLERFLMAEALHVGGAA